MRCLKDIPNQLSLNEEYERVGIIDLAIQAVIDPIARVISDLLRREKHVTVAICGGAVVGKTALFTPALAKRFDSAQVIGQDDYCVGDSVSIGRHGRSNLYVPEDFDPELLAKHVSRLKDGIDVDDKPVYSHEIRERIGSTRLEAAQVLIVEGEFLLTPPLSEQFDVKVFVDTDDHSRFIRRIIRPRRNPDQTDLDRIKEYFDLAFPLYYYHIDPTKNNADIIISNHYCPHEELERIGRRYYELPQDRSTCCYYTHLNCGPGEVVCVVSNGGSSNELIYTPDMNLLEKGESIPLVRFDLEGESIDLRDIGYSHA